MTDFCARHMWNTITQGPCCQCMTPQQRLDYLWKQMRAARLLPDPAMAKIQCPYCLSIILQGKPCCETTRKAIAAILEREDVVHVMMEGASRN